MKVVVDANPVISILIRPGKPISLFFTDMLEIAAPSLLFQEIERNIDEISSKSGHSIGETRQLLSILRDRIKIIHEKEFLVFRKKAEKICPDKKDVAYFALALYLKCPIWSNDKALKAQKYVKVWATHELFENIN